MKNSVTPCLRTLFFVFGVFTSGALSGPLEGAKTDGLQTISTLPNELTTSDWKGILAAHQSAQYRMEAHGDGSYTTQNIQQQWQVRFDKQGFVTKPDSGDWQWGLELLRYGYGTDSRAVNTKIASTTLEENRLVYRRDPILSEWYVNHVEGLQQGWTLASRPEGSTRGKTLELTLAVRGNLQPQRTSKGAVVFTNSKKAIVLNYSDLKAWDADGQCLPVQFAVSGKNLIVRVQDKDARYPVTIDPIAQQAYLKASNSNGNDTFGFSVAASGDTIVVGAPGEDSNGVQNNNSVTDSGAAYVFVRSSGGSWTQQAYLKASNADVNDGFGRSVAISGDTIVIGSVFEDSNATGINGDGTNNSTTNSGAAYVFVRNGGIWTQQAYLKASNPNVEDHFGGSVAISKDTIVIGADSEDSTATGINGNGSDNTATNSGAAYIFVRSGITWVQQSYLKASNTGAADSFGQAVTISEDTVVVAAPLEDSNATGTNGNQADNTGSNSGAAYVFVRSGVVWAQQAYLKAFNTGTNDLFGRSVAIDKDTIVVGANFEDSATGINGDGTNNALVDSGAAYIFVRSGVTWVQQAYLKASNADSTDNFGWSVAVSGDTVVVSARLEDSSAVGIGGDQTNSSTAANSGAAYIFARIGGIWSQQAYLKASNTGENDLFGWSAAISGDTVVVGANQESSNATGINGNQADNTLNMAGAAYVFQPPLIPSSVPPPTLKPKGKKKFKTSKASIVLRGTATNATQVLFKVGKKPFKSTKGSTLSWKTPTLHLKPGINIIKVRAIGPGGVSAILKFVVTLHTS